jgi:hypothetical protein
MQRRGALLPTGRKRVKTDFCLCRLVYSFRLESALLRPFEELLKHDLSATGPDKSAF